MFTGDLKKETELMALVFAGACVPTLKQQKKKKKRWIQQR